MLDLKIFKSPKLINFRQMKTRHSVSLLSVFCWSSGGHLLVICWSSVGHIMVTCQSSVNLMSNFCQSSVGLLLVFYWTYVGLLLDLCWSSVIMVRVANFANSRTMVSRSLHRSMLEMLSHLKSQRPTFYNMG